MVVAAPDPLVVVGEARVSSTPGRRFCLRRRQLVGFFFSRGWLVCSWLAPKGVGNFAIDTEYEYGIECSRKIDVAIDLKQPRISILDPDVCARYAAKS